MLDRCSGERRLGDVRPENSKKKYRAPLLASPCLQLHNDQRDRQRTSPHRAKANHTLAPDAGPDKTPKLYCRMNKNFRNMRRRAEEMYARLCLDLEYVVSLTGMDPTCPSTTDATNPSDARGVELGTPLEERGPFKAPLPAGINPTCPPPNDVHGKCQGSSCFITTRHPCASVPRG